MEEELLIELIKERAALKEAEDHIKAEVADFKDRAVPVFIAAGVKTFRHEGVGTLTMVEGTNKSISADSLRKELLRRGTGAEEVADIIERVTKETKYVTMQFVADKRKVG